MAKNKLAKFAEMENFTNVFQYPFYKIKSEEFPLKSKWNKEFFGNDNPIVLELGCGKGEYTVGMAELNPNKNYIGIDIKGARMYTGAKLSIDKSLNNVAFLRTEVELIEHFFDKNEVSEIWITFADPQMKKATKRLTSTHFLNRYKNILKEDAHIHLKTDSPFLYTYTKELIKSNNFNIYHITDDLYNDESAKELFASKIQTYYEKQWLLRGFSIKYIDFDIAKNKDFIEPDIEIEIDDYRSFGREKRSNLEMRK